MEPQRSIKGPLIILGIVALVIAAIFAIPYFLVTSKSKAQCGEGGLIAGSMNEGYHCVYYSVCESCKNSSQCPDCGQLCDSKGKIKREEYCGPNEIDLTGKIKMDSNGSIYVADMPVECYCCCDEKKEASA